MPHQPADLHDVEAEVDDQVAGKGMAEIVKPKAHAVRAKAGGVGGEVKGASLDVALAEWRPTARREHPTTTSAAGRREPALAQQPSELRRERDLPHGRPRLRRNASRWRTGMGSRELRAHVDTPAVESTSSHTSPNSSESRMPV